MAKVIIDQIEAQGFRNLYKPMVFKLPKENGFYFLTGTNKVNTDLGANGTGKSSIWDTICYTFFGKSARGLRGPDLKTWLSEDPLATGVHFHIGDAIYVIRRTWSPNSLTLQIGTAKPEKIQQDEIDQLLGCNYDLFLFVVLQGQFNTFFIDLKPTDKLQVWSKILDLDEWLIRSKKAKKKFDEEQGVVSKAEVSLSKVEGILETLKWSLQSQRKLREEEKQSRQKALNENNTAIDKHQKSLKMIASKLKTVNENQAIAGRELDKLEEREEVLYSKIAIRTQQRNKVLQAIAVHKSTERRILKEKEKFETEDLECPWCQQEITKKHKTHMLKEFDKELVICSKEISSCSETEKEIDRRVVNLKSKLEVVLDKGRTIGRDVISLLMVDKSKFLKDKEYHLYDITQLEKANENLKKASNTVKEIKRLKGQLTEAKEAKKACKASLEKANAMSVSYKLWIQVFKDIRLWLVDRALTELEMHVNNSFIELGLKGWSIEFTVQHENKSGGVSKGLIAKIKSPQQDKLVPWFVWSGGETQRIRIAVAVGLLRLIQSRTAFSCNLEVWDEPTEHMSVEGIEDLLNFFEMRKDDDDKQLWMVDHRSLDFGGFDGSVHLNRTNRGVEVKYEY